MSETVQIVEGESRVCFNITIEADDVLESMEPESFIVGVSSSDPDVTFMSSEATVFINDSSSKFWRGKCAGIFFKKNWF